jgi:cardiolipin synthase (CMP-forming)
MEDERTSRILTLPNILSLARVLLTPVFIWAMTVHRPWLAFEIFLLAGATDALDGFTARFLRLKSRLGLWLDPLGDKVLLTAAFVMLAIPHVSRPNTLPFWLVAICIGRDVAIALGALVFNWLRGRTEFKPSLAGKASTICQIMVLLAVRFYNALGTSPAFLAWLYMLTAVLTGLSGIHYFVAGARRFFARDAESSPSAEA